MRCTLQVDLNVLFFLNRLSDFVDKHTGSQVTCGIFYYILCEAALFSTQRCW